MIMSQGSHRANRAEACGWCEGIRLGDPSSRSHCHLLGAAVAKDNLQLRVCLSVELLHNRCEAVAGRAPTRRKIQYGEFLAAKAGPELLCCHRFLASLGQHRRECSIPPLLALGSSAQQRSARVREQIWGGRIKGFRGCIRNALQQLRQICHSRDRRHVGERARGSGYGMYAEARWCECEFITRWKTLISMCIQCIHVVRTKPFVECRASACSKFRTPVVLVTRCK